jgi:hypothetical protein
MKKHLIALVGVSLLLATVSAYAETIRVKANVPFSFIVNRDTLPAGEYSLESIGMGPSLLIQNADMKSRTIVNPNRCEAASASKQTKLVFRKYGNRYFLSQVWLEGAKSGQEFARSKREAEVAKDFSMQEVVLTASLH